MRLLLFLVVMFCMPAFAQDGMVIHFIVSKTSANKQSTYANGVLMQKTGAATLTFPTQYEMRIESREIGDGAVNLMITLKDLSIGKPIYAGSGATKLNIGESRVIPLDATESQAARYKIFVDTAYGKLPARSQ